MLLRTRARGRPTLRSSWHSRVPRGLDGKRERTPPPSRGPRLQPCSRQDAQHSQGLQRCPHSRSLSPVQALALQRGRPLLAPRPVRAPSPSLDTRVRGLTRAPRARVHETASEDCASSATLFMAALGVKAKTHSFSAASAYYSKVIYMQNVGWVSSKKQLINETTVVFRLAKNNSLVSLNNI